MLPARNPSCEALRLMKARPWWLAFGGQMGANMPTFTVSIPCGRVGSFLAGAAVASVVGGAATAITDTKFTYSEPKIGLYSISPADLHPGNDTAANAFYGNGDYLLYNAPDDRECFYSGVHLPQ